MVYIYEYVVNAEGLAVTGAGTSDPGFKPTKYGPFHHVNDAGHSLISLGAKQYAFNAVGYNGAAGVLPGWVLESEVVGGKHRCFSVVDDRSVVLPASALIRRLADEEFIVQTVTRGTIADELRDNVPGCEDLKPYDWRLTHDVCRWFAVKLGELEQGDGHGSRHHALLAELAGKIGVGGSAG